MKVKATLDVELDREEELNIARKVIRELVEWPDYSFAENDCLKLNSVFNTTHSWVETKIIRELNNNDKAAKTILDLINSTLATISW